MDPNLLEAVGLFSKAIKQRQGSLLTKSGNPQNFSGSRKPFIGSDPIPVNQGRTPIPPSFRPEPVSPGQLGLFDDRIGSQRFRAPSLPPALTGGGPKSPTQRGGLSIIEAIGLAALAERSTPEPNYRNLGYASEADMRGRIGAQELLKSGRYVPGSQQQTMPDLYSVQELLKSGRYVPGSQQQSIPNQPPLPRDKPPINNIVDRDTVGKNYTVGGIEYDYRTGRAINPPPNTFVPARVSPPQNNPLGDNRPDRAPLPEYTSPGNNRPDRAPLPQSNPPGNNMNPASAAFTRFFVDDANRLSPTARELATATGGVQTRDLGSLTSGLRAADLESLLNSVGSAQAMSDSPSFMAGNPLTGTPKLMLTGAREQAVNEQKQQYAKQDMGSSKLDTNKMQQEALLNVQAQREAGRALMPDILRGLGYTTNETAGLAEWARTHPELALAEYNRQIQRGSLASNLNVRSEFPSPAEIQPPDPVNYQPVGNISDYMVNTPMGSNFSNNAIGNSHYAAEAYVTGSQTATDLADATQALVQPTLQTEDQYTSQAPERMQETADVSNDMLRRAMELKMGRSGQSNLFYGN